MLVLCASLQANINGIYVLPKDAKDRQILVEIFEKDNKSYGAGFALLDGEETVMLDSKNPDARLRNRPIKGSVFLWLECRKNECSGKIYSFNRGKVYPVKTSLQDNELQIKVDVMFGPTFRWMRLNKEETKSFEHKRLDINMLDISMPKD